MFPKDSVKYEVVYEVTILFDMNKTKIKMKIESTIWHFQRLLIEEVNHASSCLSTPEGKFRVSI